MWFKYSSYVSVQLIVTDLGPTVEFKGKMPDSIFNFGGNEFFDLVTVQFPK